MIRLASVLTLFFVWRAAAMDWPRLLGPGFDNTSQETNIANTWPLREPPVLWKFRTGQGWSGPVVASNRVLVFHRLDDRETLDCLNATNGARLWRAGYLANYRDDFGFDEGPRATPTIDGTRVFTLGANGVLHCWDIANGSNVWRIDTRKEFGADKGFFGIACSPLVVGEAVILNPGGSGGTGVVALDKRDGKLLWKATDQGASYSSPIVATIAGERMVLVLARTALVALRVDSGKELWKFPFRPSINSSVSAASPLVAGDQVFISASYGAGAAVLQITEGKPEVAWSGDDILSNHYATSVYHGGFLFGFDGRQEQRCNLRCVEWKSGKIRWNEDRFGAGTLLLARDTLLILTERGELIVARATPERFSPLARAQILGSECRAYPALANGLFYARDKAMLVCVDLRLSK
jgi:hypothetical protein